MSLMILCPNCGHSERFDGDSTRRKVRCPQCGVLCPVTEGAAAKHKTAEVEDEEDVARRLLDDVEEAPRKPAPRREPALPPAPKRAAPPPRPPPVKVDDEDDDDGKPYLVEGGEERRCQQRNRVIADDAVLCVHCGLDIRKGKKIVRTYDPLARTWDLGMASGRRWNMFLLLAVLGTGLSLGLALLVGGDWQGCIVPSLVLALMLAFLLGTFFRAELVRDAKGKVKLTRTWRICFVALPPAEVDLLQFEGVRVDQVREAGLFEWLLCIDLLMYAIVPGVLWWYHIIYTDRWIVALTRDHGHAVETLYRGNDGDLAKEVAATLRDAARLREETS